MNGEDFTGCRAADKGPTNNNRPTVFSGVFEWRLGGGLSGPTNIGKRGPVQNRVFASTGTSGLISQTSLNLQLSRRGRV
jgi:hypothetical protein